MKKLVMVAMLAGSMLAMAADEAAPKPAPAPEQKAVVAPERPQRQGMSEEQRAQMRAQREKFFAQRRAEMENRAVEIIKKYGLDDAKAKELYAELQKSMRPQRRSRPMPPPKNAPVKAPAK